MAVYIPQAQRRRRVVIIAVAALVVGVAVGVLAGRVTAPTVGEQVTAVQGQARQITAQLRVLSLHAEAGAASLAAGGDGGAGFALGRVAADLDAALQQAPWIPAGQADVLRERLHQVQTGDTATAGAGSGAFGTVVDRLAADIDTAFGLGASR